MLDSILPGGCRFQRICRSEYYRVGNHTQAHHLLDGLMGRTVFPYRDTVMGKDEQGLDFHKSRHADSRTHKIREHKERCAKGD